MSDTWTHENVTDIYRKWAPVYDKVFGNVFDSARRSAIAACNRVGGQVLDVGVGTGLALPHYASQCRVTGVDLSEEMLNFARRRVAREKLSNVESLALMDAQNLDFADATFDVVMAQYVVNTVPDPDAALDEFIRVLKSGGELIIVNRIGAEAGPRLQIEKLLQPVVERLGWRSEFGWDRFEKWASRHPVTLLERRPLPPFHHFALIRYGKTVAESRSATYARAN